MFISSKKDLNIKYGMNVSYLVNSELSTIIIHSNIYSNNMRTSDFGAFTRLFNEDNRPAQRHQIYDPPTRNSVSVVCIMQSLSVGRPFRPYMRRAQCLRDDCPYATGTPRRLGSRRCSAGDARGTCVARAKARDSPCTRSFSL